MSAETIDYTWPPAKVYRDARPISLWQKLLNPPSSYFFDTCVKAIFKRSGFILDIGGGLRLDKNRGNKVDASNQKKFLPYLSQPNVHYKVTDYTDKYNPDYVEDIHHLSFADSSVDALFCLSVLEHIYDPKRASEEIVRVLKKDGLGLLYVPFLYRYHAHGEDYRDYFRYSKDAISYLFRDCQSVEICPVRGLFETMLKFTPLSVRPLVLLARFLDTCSARMRRASEKQASAYVIFIRK